MCPRLPATLGSDRSCVTSVVCKICPVTTSPVVCVGVVARKPVSRVQCCEGTLERARIRSVISRTCLGDENGDKGEHYEEKEGK